MSAHLITERVPDHLVGTREGLFHLLRGATIVPPEDPMARAELPRIAIPQSSQSPQHPQVFSRTEQEKIAAFLREDEFFFNL